VRRIDFPSGDAARPGELPEVLWFGPDGRRKDWRDAGPSLTCVFSAPLGDRTCPDPRHVLIMAHAGRQARDFTIPLLPKPVNWRVFLDTRQNSPNDIFPDLDGPFPPPLGRVCLDHHSMMVFVSTE
jgi:glycogen operon protein